MTFPLDGGSPHAQNRPAAHRLTREQEAIWLNDALSEGRSCYTMLWAHRLRGDVDPDAVEGALTDVIHRYESLRSRFLMADGTPVQQVAEASCRPVNRADCAEPELGERLTRSTRPTGRCGPRCCAWPTTTGCWPCCCTIW